ncbi:SLC13A2_3_5 [Mytilus coruscus]|uniref:SLC13A2_3_5 n=1 Tax=Mytilus coruscus TaxID=42192 RepID=A0A6J8EMP1_MYTCO|nr:SLC13A2_3_5 [Mytilus coruscus]
MIANKRISYRPQNKHVNNYTGNRVPSKIGGIIAYERTYYRPQNKHVNNSRKPCAIQDRWGTIFVFLGGMSLTVCIEKWNIHRRFALKLLLLLGTSTKWLTFGFMVTTAFMSMWVSNTATTSMMIPIGQAVLVELVRVRKRKSINQEEKDIG